MTKSELETMRAGMPKNTNGLNVAEELASATLKNGVVADIEAPMKPLTPEEETDETRKILRLLREYRFDAITGKTEIKPCESGNVWGEMTEREFQTIYKEYRRDGGKERVEQIRGLIISRFTPKVNRITDYLDALMDDGRDHISEFCAKVKVIGGQEEQEVFRRYFALWLRGVYIMWNGGEPSHQGLFLVGKQGTGKTYFLSRLCPIEDLAYTGGYDAHDKDSSIRLTTRLMINLDELESMSKGDVKKLKSAMTARDVTERKPYGRADESAKRIAAFVGSSNVRHFLNDDTGTRRFLVFEIEEIENCGRFNFDISKIWAQAKAEVSAGERTYFDSADNARINARNEGFAEMTVEEDLLLMTFRPCEKGKGEFLIATQIMNEMQMKLDKESYQTSIGVKGEIEQGYKGKSLSLHLNKNKMGAALQKHGFERVPSRVNGLPIKGYWVKRASANNEDNAEYSAKERQEEAF